MTPPMASLGWAPVQAQENRVGRIVAPRPSPAPLESKTSVMTELAAMKVVELVEDYTEIHRQEIDTIVQKIYRQIRAKQIKNFVLMKMATELVVKQIRFVAMVNAKPQENMVLVFTVLFETDTTSVQMDSVTT